MKHNIPVIKPLKPEPKRRLVDFYQEPADHLCAIMAANGASTKWIMKETGLSPGQVAYRVRKAGLGANTGLSRQDFRNGTSPFSKYVFQRVMKNRDMDKRLYALLEGQAIE